MNESSLILQLLPWGRGGSRGWVWGWPRLHSETVSKLTQMDKDKLNHLTWGRRKSIDYSTRTQSIMDESAVWPLSQTSGLGLEAKWTVRMFYLILISAYWEEEREEAYHSVMHTWFQLCSFEDSEAGHWASIVLIEIMCIAHTGWGAYSLYTRTLLFYFRKP